MKRIPCLIAGLLALLLADVGLAAEFKFPHHTFTVPDGFVVELAAGPPLVERPIVADFDEQGRLYVADSSGSNDKVEKQLQEKPHRIWRLEDTNGDGRFDRSQLFADQMMFPEGAMWLEGSLYVSAPPSIWKLTDTDGDGAADQREEWFQGKTLTGCANDLHGPYLGPDGWIYWAKGAFAKQTHERPGQAPFVTRASHIFRARPDGSGIEAVMTGGMDNPVDVVFTPAGERIFTTTFFQHPGGGQRDGLIHAVYGGVYGKSHDVLDDHKKTGDLMPVLTHMGPAAPCGLTRYSSRVFGADYQDNLFACQFNLHKISRHVLEPYGATYRTHDSDFFVSDNTDFHPTDVIEDADGSLIVVNTGGWYKLCCPTSQLAKPDVLGQIYRLRRQGAPKPADPRGLQLAWATMNPTELVKLLGDDRPAVRQRAVRALGKKGGESIAALVESLKMPAASVEARRNAVWALTRIDGEEARKAVRGALSDREESVRQVAGHSASLWRDAGAAEPLMDWLQQIPPQLQRLAAEALGRIGAHAAVPRLLRAAAASRNDRVLEHSLIYALIEIADPSGTATGLAGAAPPTRRAALIALDQMEGGGLKPEQITPLLAAADPALRQTAHWIASHHPEWGAALAGYFRERLAAHSLTETERNELPQQLSQFARDQAIQDLLAGAADASAPAASRLTALRAMARASLKQAPRGWVTPLQNSLAADHEAVVRASVAAVRALPPLPANDPDFSTVLLHVAKHARHPADLRLEALAALPSRDTKLDTDLFGFLQQSVAPAQPLLVRSAAAGVLGRLRLNDEQLLALTGTVKSAGPLELPKLLGAFERATNEALGLTLMASLKESKGASCLRADVLNPRLTNFPDVVRQKGEALIASLNTDLAKQMARLDELAVALKDGDIRRGQAIFNSQKTACASCHAIGYLGGNIGPDLTRIGQIRTERDLLEAIVFPSASFVRSYESVVVATKDGEEYSGVLRKDANDEVVLATGPGVEQRIARSNLSEMRPGNVSVMPAGMDEQLTRQELVDLVAFLKGTKW